jgi:DNA-binding beta-propeller fold protein YncE
VPQGGSVTFQWSSDATGCSAGGAWSGAKAASGAETITGLTQTSTFTLNCSRDSRSAQAALRVVLTPQGVPLEATPTEVFSENGLTSLKYTIVPIAGVGMVWDSRNARLHVITAATSPEYPSSVISIDPSTRVVTAAQALASVPTTLAVSANGEYVYVAFPRSLIRRFQAADLTPDISIDVGSDETRILRLAVAPNLPRTVAVIRSQPDGGLKWGLQVFDDAAPRPEALFESVDLSGVSWSADGSFMYAQAGGVESGIYYVSVLNEGLRLDGQRRWNAASAGTLNGTIFYADDGRVYELAPPVRQLGRFTDYERFQRYASGTWSRSVAIDRKKAFATWPNNPNGFEEGTTLASYNLDSLTTTDTITFLGAAAFVGGSPVPWGDAGIALRGPTGLLIAEGTFAAEGGVRTEDDTLPIIASGTSNVGETVSVRSAESISYRALDIDATDVVADSCGGLYVSISGISDVLPNSVISLDPSADTVRARIQFSGEPQELAVSDDCSVLYVGSQHSNSVARIRTADFTVDQTVHLDDKFQNGTTLSRARSIAVAPGLPHTFAAATADMGVALCDSINVGIAIFDDAVERPGTLQVDSFYRPKSIAWGATAAILYGDDGRIVYEYGVDASGAHSPRELFGSGAQTYLDIHLYNVGRNLNFDPLTGRLFDPFGQVYVTETRELVGPINLVHPTGSKATCDAPTAAKTVDVRTGRIYFGSLMGRHLSLSVIDRQSLSTTSNYSVPWDGAGYIEPLGSPVRLARINGGLVLLTDEGNLVIASGTSLQ